MFEEMWRRGLCLEVQIVNEVLKGETALIVRIESGVWKKEKRRDNQKERE